MKLESDDYHVLNSRSDDAEKCTKSRIHVWQRYIELLSHSESTVEENETQRKHKAQPKNNPASPGSVQLRPYS